MKRFFVLLIFALAGPLAAQTLRNEMLVSAEWLASHLDQVTVIEIGDQDSYTTAHVPGARLIEPHKLLTKRNDVPNELPTVEALEGVFSRAGAGEHDRIILYSSDPLLAARAWFTLDYLGHGHRTALLDGGLARWVAEGLSTTDEIPLDSTSSFSVREKYDAVTGLRAMKEFVRWRHVHGSNLVIIDARTQDQFNGEVAGLDVERPGHLPGAVNIPWHENLTTGMISRMLPERELRELYAGFGVTTRSANVVYCRTGMQASLTYFVLRYLGYEASLFDGSFIEWSRDLTTAIAARLRPRDRVSSLSPNSRQSIGRHHSQEIIKGEFNANQKDPVSELAENTR